MTGAEFTLGAQDWEHWKEAQLGAASAVVTAGWRWGSGCLSKVYTSAGLLEHQPCAQQPETSIPPCPCLGGHLPAQFPEEQEARAGQLLL